MEKKVLNKARSQRKEPAERLAVIETLIERSSVKTARYTKQLAELQAAEVEKVKE